MFLTDLSSELCVVQLMELCFGPSGPPYIDPVSLRKYQLLNHCACLLPSEFFERTILCNSLVWSCALTGRAGLTYLEAVESERRAKQSLQNFPQAVVVPLLHLAALSRRCRLTELCEDVYTFVKDRFFPGETVDVTGRNGARYPGGGV